ncbi:MAG: VWA domain-containing protein, partial [Anaerolineales bacterium]|nr:VWA domain-containing protein [Anaerolineales bacterium]
GARLEYVKAAAREIIAGLQDDDALALVTFSDRAQVVLPSQVGGDRAAAKARVSAIQVGGGTEILQGLQAGLAQIRQRHSDSVTSHLILLTDGHTYGDEQECLAEAQQAGREHIRITTVGIGEDWNDTMLDGIANHSGGISTYASTPAQVRTLLQEAVRGLGAVFAQGMRLLPHCAANVRVENAFCVTPALRRLPVDADGTIELGALEGAGPLTAVLELSVRETEVGERSLLQPELIADVPMLEIKGYRMWRDVPCTFTPAEPPTVPAPLGLVSALNRVTLYTMQEQAWVALERGDHVSATDRLKMMSLRLHDLGAA